MLVLLLFILYIDELPDMLTSELKLFDKSLVYNNRPSKNTLQLDLIKLEENFL